MSKQSTLALSRLGISAFMLCLKALVAPQKIIHVGAGRGVGELHVWQHWNVADALIIDADSQRTKWVKTVLPEQSRWKFIEAIVAETTNEVEYFQASNPDEDSYFPVKELKLLWSNMRVVQSHLRKTETLANLIEQSDFFKSSDLTFGDEAPATTWAMIDCLPADSILKSAGQWIDSLGVVIARVLLAPLPDTGALGQNVTVEAYLRAANFRPVAVFESQHPSIGYAVFVKDWSAMTAAQITNFKNTLHNNQQEQVRVQGELDEIKYQMQRLTFDRDTQLVRIEELRSEIEVHLKELSLAKALLANNELIQQEKSPEDVAIQIRQQHLQDDLLRAEAQIELIKDLMFTRPAL